MSEIAIVIIGIVCAVMGWVGLHEDWDHVKGGK